MNSILLFTENQPKNAIDIYILNQTIPHKLKDWS